MNDRARVGNQPDRTKRVRDGGDSGRLEDQANDRQFPTDQQRREAPDQKEYRHG